MILAKKIKEQRGYTLAEVLIVLIVFSMVITITIISFKPLIKYLQIHYFFEQLQLDITYSQMYAFSNYTDVHIRFYPESHRYEIYPNGLFEPILVKRSYSENIGIKPTTLPTPVTFLANGRIKKAGKMNVSYHDDKYSFVFLFGKGQTYVEKL